MTRQHKTPRQPGAYSKAGLRSGATTLSPPDARHTTTLSSLRQEGPARKMESMIKHRSLYVAAYDVRDPRRLRRALQLLRRYSSGGQKSVHECFLTDAEKESLLREAGEVMDFREDHFLVVPLDPRSRVRTLGIAVAPSDPPFYYAD